MSTQTLKINIPNGFKIKKFDEQTGEVSFEPLPKDIKERIKTFDDAVKELQLRGAIHQFITDTMLPPDVEAYLQLRIIAAALNEGWIPDYSNSNQRKHYPWFEWKKLSSGFGFSCNGWAISGAHSRVGSPLVFKSAELAEYAGRQFEDIYRKYLTFNTDKNETHRNQNV